MSENAVSSASAAGQLAAQALINPISNDKDVCFQYFDGKSIALSMAVSQCRRSVGPAAIEASPGPRPP
jgi:hypothetical protein